MDSIQRKEIMDLMNSTDDFFREFGKLDDKAFEQGVISKKHKELCMVAISIVTKCSECAEYHINESVTAGASKQEIVETIKMGMMASGSTSYPYVRKAFAFLNEKNLT